MDRNIIEQQINILKRYYNPAKSNYRRLDDLITTKADYFDIVQTLEEIKGIKNTPEKIYNFIEDIITNAKNLYNAQVKIEYEKTQIQKKLIDVQENNFEPENNIESDFTAAKSNLIILSIVVMLILTMSLVCTLFYKICL